MTRDFIAGNVFIHSVKHPDKQEFGEFSNFQKNFKFTIDKCKNMCYNILRC